MVSSLMAAIASILLALTLIGLGEAPGHVPLSASRYIGVIVTCMGSGIIFALISVAYAIADRGK